MRARIDATLAATIGARLHALRQYRGWSIREVHRQTGLPQASIRLIERGERYTQTTARRLIQCYGLAWEDLHTLDETQARAALRRCHETYVCEKGLADLAARKQELEDHLYAALTEIRRLRLQQLALQHPEILDTMAVSSASTCACDQEGWDAPLGWSAIG